MKMHRDEDRSFSVSGAAQDIAAVNPLTPRKGITFAISLAVVMAAASTSSKTWPRHRSARPAFTTTAYPLIHNQLIVP